MSDIDKIEPVPFEWTTSDSEGITAQPIDTILIDVSSDTMLMNNNMSVSTITSGSITTASGYNGTWLSGTGSITLTDPYEEMEKRLAALEEIIAEEKRIRDECPAVRNAYDEYRFLLVLAQRNKTDS